MRSCVPACVRVYVRVCACLCVFRLHVCALACVRACVRVPACACVCVCASHCSVLLLELRDDGRVLLPAGRQQPEHLLPVLGHDELQGRLVLLQGRPQLWGRGSVC